MLGSEAVETVEDDKFDVVVRLFVDKLGERGGGSCCELKQCTLRTFDGSRVLRQSSQARRGFVFDRVGRRRQQLRDTPDPLGLSVSLFAELTLPCDRPRS